MITIEMTDSSWATLDAEEDSPHELRRDIIAVGASTGGLSAICQLLGRLPDMFDSAILIALNFGSQPACSVLQILSGYCRLTISIATDGALIRRNCVLMAPMGYHMHVTPPGIIRLEEEHAFLPTSPCVNRLFESCAATYGARVIGVLLSGASHDGAKGLKRIGVVGGIGMVQEPQEAAEPSMPAHAMRHARPAYCGVIDEMVPMFVLLASGAALPVASPRPAQRAIHRAGDAIGRGDGTADSSSTLSRLRFRQRRWIQRMLG